MRKTNIYLFELIFFIIGYTQQVYSQENVIDLPNPLKQEHEIQWRLPDEMPLSPILLDPSVYFPTSKDLNIVAGNPYTMGINASGYLWKWDNGLIHGSHTQNSMWGLFDQRSVEVNLIQHYGALEMASGIAAYKYWMPGKQETQIGMSALLTYRFNQVISITAFGQYVTNPFYVSMAAYPYINTSAYGAYLTLQNEKIGLSLGVQREYDPFRRQWITDPIIMPSFKMGKTTIQIDFGPALRYGIQNLIRKDRYNQGPIIPHP